MRKHLYISKYHWNVWISWFFFLFIIVILSNVLYTSFDTPYKQTAVLCTARIHRGKQCITKSCLPLFARTWIITTEIPFTEYANGVLFIYLLYFPVGPARAHINLKSNVRMINRDRVSKEDRSCQTKPYGPVASFVNRV